MNCPKCGQWNPDDKRVCWRCDTELPKPVEKKPKRTTLFLGLPWWTWLMLALMITLLLAAQCLGPAMINR